MADYLEREQVVERLSKLLQMQETSARAIVEAIPAADVRPVGLCRDCKHRDNVRNGACMARRPDWFCADGEKREATP